MLFKNKTKQNNMQKTPTKPNPDQNQTSADTHSKEQKRGAFHLIGLWNFWH